MKGALSRFIDPDPALPKERQLFSNRALKAMVLSWRLKAALDMARFYGGTWREKRSYDAVLLFWLMS